MSDNAPKTGELAASEVHRLDALVDIADDAIVSRTLLRSDGGNVTVFAFDGGQALAEHSAPFDALVVILEGSLTVTIDGVDSALSTGEAIVMPADVPHAVRATTPAKWMLVMLK